MDGLSVVDTYTNCEMKFATIITHFSCFNYVFGHWAIVEITHCEITACRLEWVYKGLNSEQADLKDFYRDLRGSNHTKVGNKIRNTKQKHPHQTPQKTRIIDVHCGSLTQRFTLYLHILCAAIQVWKKDSFIINTTVFTFPVREIGL